GTVGLWSLVVRGTYSPADLTVGIDPAHQVRAMLADPAEFLWVVLRTAKRSVFLAEGYLGFLGLFDVRLPAWTVAGGVILLVLVCAREFGIGSGITGRQALASAGVGALVTLTVLVAIHITWDKVGAKDVSVQGRYFIPVGPLGGIALGWLAGWLPLRMQR